MSLKVCGKCKNNLPADTEHFSKNKRDKSGLAAICKKCKSEYDKEYRAKNKERIKDYHRHYARQNEVEIKSYQRSYRKENAEKLRVYRESNKDEMKLRNKIYWDENKTEEKKRIAEWRKNNDKKIKLYRIQNRERDAVRRRKWEKTENGKLIRRTITNKRRAKIKGLRNDFTAEQWKECLSCFEWSCAYCGVESEVIEQEHFVPVNKGGGFTKNNILPSCRKCNASKADKDFDEWYTTYENFSKERRLRILEYLGVGCLCSI